MSVFQLKYRPSKLSDLDSEIVSLSLIKLLKSKDIPQALLFSGPKGAGKTSAARIVARSLNCTESDGVEPCGNCSNCKEIMSGNCLDVIEIDAASNRGIDEARSLKDRAYLSPARMKVKVFIIDEVHMMTRDAFNALLKLLEEPPSQTIFILCTTDEDKIPETVLSRLTKISFEKGRSDDMIKSLHRIVKGEGITINDEALKIIAANSDGSFRNLHKLFNEVYRETGEQMTVENVEKYFKTKLGSMSIDAFEALVMENNLTEILNKFEDMAKSGVDFKQYRERLIEYFHHKLLEMYGVEEKLKGGLGQRELEKLLQLLIGAGKIEKDAFIPQLPLELAVIELISSPKADPTPIRKQPEVEVSKSKNEPAIKKLLVEKKKDVVEEKIKIDFGVNKITDDWGKVLMAVKPFNHSVEAFLRAVRPVKLSGKVLVCEVFYPFHKDKLEELKNRVIVEKGLSDVFGVSLEFQCTLAKSKLEPIVVQNDTPENVMEQAPPPSGDEMYDVAKQIFG